LLKPIKKYGLIIILDEANEISKTRGEPKRKISVRN
jgi:hypothetical protein